MQRRSFQNNARRTAAAGFSLVELLTVIAIIVLLIAILVPAVNKVRENAKATTTKAMIGTFSTGLETFRADQQLGGAYPPSAPDLANNNNALLYRVESPYAANLQGPTGQFDISGAGLLVWALAGADLSGCPGFRPFRTGSVYWAEDTMDDPEAGGGAGAYALNETTFEPLRPRVGPFVDMSNVEVTRWNPNALNGGSFEIPMELEARQSMGEQLPNMPLRNYPMFVDAFGGPFLYWRADPSGIQAADRSPNNIPPNGQGSRGIYHFLDNGALVSDVGGGWGTSQDAIKLRPRNTPEPHNLRLINPMMPVGGGPDPTEPLDGFWAYVRNKAVQAKVAPHNPDTFMIISAGPDGIYGSADDIANFPHNGAELTNPE